ncbi:hypothetical protein V6N11_060451 [Hibiscus sabdariffa]|uniref:Uncharacterized protein n=1 Tax=Hibiscus sabdariffa TaxID=183260 RepID=A0ABR2QQD4_9ROSI
MASSKRNPTMIADVTNVVTMKGLQLVSNASKKAEVASSDNLGALMNSGFHGIMAEQCKSKCGTRRTICDALVMSGGFFN